jgi:hypothetical protein
MPGFYFKTTSAMDGKPIVVAAVTPESVGNTKTGQMAQVYILPDVPMKMQQAWDEGHYASVCGDCGHMTHRSCYVVKFHGSRAVMDAITKGSPSYTYTHPEEFARRLALCDDVRFGADGDPAAIPKREWHIITSHMSPDGSHCAYTHQWGKGFAEHLRLWAMASADTPEQALQAHKLGWRTFRTRLPEEPLMDGEFVCPASAEAGHKVQCIECGACSGLDPTRPRQANPTIIGHKNTKRYRQFRLALANQLGA